MHYVLIGTHSPEICPSSNAKTRKLLLQLAPQIPKIAQEANVNIVAGPYINREHSTIVVVEAHTGEDLDKFLTDSRLPQWNSVRVLPSVPMDQSMSELEAQPALF
jgi:hypothetical protein